MLSIKDLPAFHGRNRYAQHFSQLDPEKQVVVLMESLGTHHLVRDSKVVSTSTANVRFHVVRLCLSELCSHGMHIRNTPHGLRHQYANDLYEAVAGQPSAVRGGGPVVDHDKDLEARQEVTSDLGHARLQITAAYTGTRGPARFAVPPAALKEQPSP